MKESSQGRTVLHEAVFAQDIELVEIILKFDGDMNIQDNNGSSPFDDAEVAEDIKALMETHAKKQSV